MSTDTATDITTITSLSPSPTEGLVGAFADGLQPLAQRANGLVGSVIDSSTSLLARQSHDVVRFAMGAPAPEAIPVQLFTDLAEETFDEGSFTYGATEGEPGLVDSLVSLSADSPEPIEEAGLVVTAGGMQGLDLAFKLFVDPGDLVVVESPTYTNGSATALAYGADLLEVPCDDDGMDVDRLETRVSQIGRTPKAIYTIPNFQNPSGVTLSMERRVRLLELAERWGSVIVDDDPYGMLRFSGEDVPGFAALSPGNPQVFRVRTFSKTLAPGLRVGWVSTDPALRQLIINAKQAMDTCTNVPNQHIVDAFIRTGGFNEHLVNLRAEYRRRKESMLASIATHLGDRVRATDPEGGFFLWLTLLGDDAEIDTMELFEIALAEGVAFIPGPALSPGGHFHDALRLCFASTTPERADEGIQRLARALDRARAS